MNINRFRKEITIPVTANPLGSLKHPTKEKMYPKNHIMNPKTGIQLVKIATVASTNPAIPILLEAVGGSGL